MFFNLPKRVGHWNSPYEVGQHNLAKEDRGLFREEPSAKFLLEIHLLHQAKVDKCHGELHAQNRIQEYLWAIHLFKIYPIDINGYVL